MNKNYKIIEVTDRRSAKEFLLLPVRLYKNDKNYIRPLDRDVERIFDPKQNKYFRHGECTRWILKDEKGKTIGRVAAFIDKKKAYKHEFPCGGMGFFECINDKEAASTLFDQCKSWLMKRSMEAMDGPVNFGERHQWWGLLVDGFTEPIYCMPYNYEYYRELFESYGFKVYFNQYTYHRTIETELNAVVIKKAEKVIDNPDYTFEHLKKNDLAKYTEDFRIVYNKGWVKHQGVSRMSSAQARTIINKMKPVMDPELMWYAYYKDEPVAFFLMIPDLNQIIKKLKGKLGITGKLKFLYYNKTKTCKKVIGAIFGVIPEHQGKGVESAIVVAFSKISLIPGFRYTELEMNWIGDFNPKMMHVAEQVGGTIYKTHITYRYIFDPSVPFRRAASID